MAQRRTEVAFEWESAGIGWLPDGRLLIVNRLERTIVRREPDGALVHHGDLRPWATWHANDMVVASDGQAYVGNFGFDLDGLYDGTTPASAIAPASVIRVDPDGTSSEAAVGVNFPNGMVVTEDGGTLIVAESLGGSLKAFDRASDGTLSNERRVGGDPGVAPDGICLCADNTVWVANALGAGVRPGGRGRRDPRARGDVDRTATPACWVMTTAAPSTSSPRPRATRPRPVSPATAALEKVRTTVPGAGLP